MTDHDTATAGALDLQQPDSTTRAAAHTAMATAANITAAPSPTRALAAWRRAGRRPLAILAWLALAAFLFVRFWPVNLANDSLWRVLIDLVAFMGRTFVHYVGGGLVVLALAALVVRLRWTALLLSVAALIALWPVLSRLAPRPPLALEPAAITVLSANLFDMNRTPDALAREIAATDADVILLQEYTPAWHAILAPLLSANFPHQLCAPRHGGMGTATYARVPFAEKPRYIDLRPEPYPNSRVVLDLAGRRVALYNIHLMPPQRILLYRYGRIEFGDLADLLRRETLPTVVCGDFNFTLDSAQADALAELGFEDAIDHAGSGPRWTWPAVGRLRHFPGVRIDHVFVTPQLGASDIELLPSHGSDHRPVRARLHFRR